LLRQVSALPRSYFRLLLEAGNTNEAVQILVSTISHKLSMIMPLEGYYGMFPWREGRRLLNLCPLLQNNMKTYFLAKLSLLSATMGKRHNQVLADVTSNFVAQCKMSMNTSINKTQSDTTDDFIISYLLLVYKLRFAISLFCYFIE